VWPGVSAGSRRGTRVARLAGVRLRRPRLGQRAHSHYLPISTLSRQRINRSYLTRVILSVIVLVDDRNFPLHDFGFADLHIPSVTRPDGVLLRCSDQELTARAIPKTERELIMGFGSF
jgi:hypothetical protein